MFCMCLWIMVFHGWLEAGVLEVVGVWGQVVTADLLERHRELIVPALGMGGSIQQHFAPDGVELEATATGRKAGGAATVSA